MPGNDGPYAGLPNKVVEAANGANYAYRDTGGSAGTTPDTIEQMTRDAIAFLTAMDACTPRPRTGGGGTHRAHRVLRRRSPGRAGRSGTRRRSR
jgi:hypothetical protein